MTTVLAISPHLDDAVFSAGGLLARRAAEGCRVVVATVFTASMPDPQGFALACQLDKGLAPDVDYMALRREEDATACAILDVEAIWLPYAEAPHRGYHSAADLFGPVHSDDAIVSLIGPRLSGLIEQLKPDELLAPMALGAHVDHVAVVEAILRLRRPLQLWTDFPYSIRSDFRPSPFQDRLQRCAKSSVELNADEARLKFDAMLAYKTQIAFQFGPLERTRDILREHSMNELFAIYDAGHPASGTF